MKTTKYIILCGLCLNMHIQAQSFNYNQFLNQVAKSNTAYMAEKFNIDIAIAEEQAAKVFNNPEISFTYGNNQDWNLQMGQTYEAELSYTIPLGGVRSSQMRVAAASRQVEEAAVADYWCALKLEAAQAFAYAWLTKQQAIFLEENWHTMQQIAQSDSIRLQIGDLNPTDAMQTALEALTTKSQWLDAKYAYKNALTELSRYIGGQTIDDVELLEQDFVLGTLEDLQQQAQNNRSDLKMAYWQQTLSQNALRLIKAERAPEITLSASYVHSTEVRNELAPAPKYNGFSVGIALPLNFSSINRGAKTAAENKVKQTELNYQAIKEQINAEVEQAYNQYLLSKEVLGNYDTTILDQAKQIQQNRQLAYKQGDIGLIQLLEANRTYREILSSYYETIANHFVSVALLMRCIGE